MNDKKDNKKTSPSISYFQGAKQVSSDSAIDVIKSKVAELSNLKNINFLFGAGVSSGAIPTMSELQKELGKKITSDKKITDNVRSLYSNLSDDNLEYALGVLYSQKSYLEGLVAKDEEQYQNVTTLIDIVQSFMYSKINVDLSNKKSQETLDTYKKFYQKTTFRNKDLARVNVFTTNNDLFNEKALDSLNINYNNGFGGGLDRVFNPARFKYTYSRKIDSNLDKFEPLENMIYLYKLHGSINWQEETGNSLFNIHEVTVSEGREKRSESHVLIYPTPLKQNQSLGAPYSDLIREFKMKLAKANSVLFVIGYSFSDEHLNNIIYQSLASNSSLSIFIFGEYKKCPLTSIYDNRIYQAYGLDENNNKIHYFQYIVDNLLPVLNKDQDSSLLEEFSKAIHSATVQGSI